MASWFTYISDLVGGGANEESVMETEENEEGESRKEIRTEEDNAKNNKIYNVKEVDVYQSIPLDELTTEQRSLRQDNVSFGTENEHSKFEVDYDPQIIQMDSLPESLDISMSVNVTPTRRTKKSNETMREPLRQELVY
ncbi:hypothetical protein PRIPAC_82959 [Pristionchus pacificus]|uniref:Uncharacterized protein n=1 Tax=Pristionchus pacificus TaxID=54126 RepID=A0A2A6BZ58_PRIPA|nr:hypothetical protein PRIPAC_82959 [Pristionchus pacificus]|eukprot:PDM71063.1 hypothetical protein PRIPAC_44459 [Pristionchus pacificus]